MSGQPVILCEGEADVICARSHGLNAVTQTGGAGTWKRAFSEALRGRDVVIAYDADLAGLLGAMRVVTDLTGQAQSIRLVLWPEAMIPPPGEDDDKSAAKRTRALKTAWTTDLIKAAGDLPGDHGQDLTDYFAQHAGTADGLMSLAIDITGPVQAKELPPPPPSDDEESGPGRFWARADDGRLNFRSALLARELHRGLELITDRESRAIYAWCGTHYRPILEEDVVGLALAKLGVLATMAKARDAAQQAITLSYLPDGEEMNTRPELLCLPNGMLNLDTLEVLPHDRKYRATVMLPWPFDAAAPADCPRFYRYLTETIIRPRVIHEVQEFFGYCLWRGCEYEKALITIGVEGSGKGTLLHVLRRMLGADNCASVDIGELEDKFTRAGLHDKAANIFFETDAQRFTVKWFNALVSGDPLRAAFKFRDEFDLKPRCKLAMSANEVPLPFNATEAYFDRLLPVRYIRKFRGTDKQDPRLKERLYAEMPGIFAWAVVGLCRLRARGRFEPSPETRAFLEQYRADANPIKAFLDECCDLGPSLFEVKRSVYNSYRLWCKRTERRPWAENTFGRRLKALGPSLGLGEGRESGGKRRPTVTGLALGEDAPLEM